MNSGYSLNVFEQQFTAIYTPISIFYPLVDETQHSAIIEILNKGLEQLASAFPWIAGQVVSDGASNESSGVLSIKPKEEPLRLIVKDIRQDPLAPTRDALKGAEFPFQLLDENIVAPCNTIPGTERVPFPKESGMPVLLVQANFIVGGLILTINGQHQAMDMTGQGYMISMLSKACRREPFSSPELTDYNSDRCGMVRLYNDSWQPTYELDRHIAKPLPKPQPHPEKPEEGECKANIPSSCTWTYYLFSSSALAAIKDLATKSLATGSSWISTDDALSAFVWQSIQRVRRYRLESSKPVTLARAVDCRRLLNVSPNYPGVCLNMAFHEKPLSDLLNSSPGEIAALLRRGIDPTISNTEHLTRAFATVLHRTPDKRTLNFMANMDWSCDLFLSSWARLNLCELDFGLGLGKPEAARRPAPIPVEGLIFFMPKQKNGEIAVGLCLRGADLERLKRDQSFIKYARFVG